MLLGEPWVLVRADDGVHAFVDRCPHRHCPLSLGRCEAGVLQCAYHGWGFDSAGRCVEIPALGPSATLPPAAKLRPAAAVAEAHGMVFLAPEAPIAPLGSVPRLTTRRSSWGSCRRCGPEGSAGLLADNFLDIAHFPFVHTGTFGADEAAEVAPFAVTRDDWSFTVAYEHPFAHREDPGVAGRHPPADADPAPHLPSQRAVPPCGLRIDFVDSGGSNVIGFFIQPESDETLPALHNIVARRPRRRLHARMAEAVDYELDVLREDLRDPRGVPRSHPPARSRRPRCTPGPIGRLSSSRRVLADLVAADRGAGGAEHGTT